MINDLLTNAAYYYLTDTDIIQEGDTFTDSRGGLGYIRCRSSVGKTIADGLDYSGFYKVRRQLKITKLGNHI